jgi:putative addiction module CopG family antidote
MTITVTLPPALDAFVRERVAAGFYASEAEVIADAVRRMVGFGPDQDDAWLREAFAEGLATPLVALVAEGLEGPFDSDWNADEVWDEALKLTPARHPEAG